MKEHLWQEHTNIKICHQYKNSNFNFILLFICKIILLKKDVCQKSFFSIVCPKHYKARLYRKNLALLNCKKRKCMLATNKQVAVLPGHVYK